MSYINFRWEQHDEIALVRMDKAGDKVNTLSQDLFEEFNLLYDELMSNSTIKGIVIISAKRDFIVGADINMFEHIKKEGDFLPIGRQLHQILFKIERSTKPVIAAIHGTCYGGGLELALACHARIAGEDSSTKLALPEVKLGLLPGGGGTQRLPRLVGIQKALDMMLTGKNIFSRPALKMGLIDQLVHKNKLEDAAIIYAKRLIKSPLQRKSVLSLKDKLIEGLAKGMVYSTAAKTVTKLSGGHYPAPYAIIDCVKFGMSTSLEKGLEYETVQFEKLALSDISKQLIRLFFLMTEKKKNPHAALVKKVNTLGMIGAGFMGEGIAEVSMNSGMDVVLKDISEEAISKAYQRLWKTYSDKVKKKILREPQAKAQMAQLSSGTQDQILQHADLIIEAVFEDLSLKQRILKSCEPLLEKNIIFASNTSALPIKDIAQHASRKDLIIGMHYFSPVPKMPLLEIVKTPDTAEWVIATCLEVGIRQGKTCIVVADGPGFYTTRILAPMLNETLLLLEEGADMLQIDKAMRAFGFPVGPVTLIDEVGIDVGAHIMSGDLMKYFSTREGLKISPAMKTLFDAGYHGRKNGKGFYLYDAQGKKVKGKINEDIYQYFGGSSRKQFSDEEIVDRCSAVFINEAVWCLEEGIIANPTDGDVGAIFGLGFPPFRGGPFMYLDQLGIALMLEKLSKLSQQHGARFNASKLLQEMQSKGAVFYPKN